MKLIFLEPINVLNSRAHRRKLLEMNDFHNYDNFVEREFEGTKIALFKRILDETDAKMVLYTKERCCSQKIGALMHKLTTFGLPDSYWFDTIPSGGDAYQALQQWLINKTHLNVEKYVILDNIINGQTSEHATNLFWCDQVEGLTDEVTQNIINFLNSES